MNSTRLLLLLLRRERSVIYANMLCYQCSSVAVATNSFYNISLLKKKCYVTNVNVSTLLRKDLRKKKKLVLYTCEIIFVQHYYIF